MAEQFDPYHKWLGISPKEQPPHHYRLLGIELFETDPDVIEGAADQRMSHVRTFQTGQNSALSQRLLNELSAAKLCLLTPQKKAEYDRQLRQKIEREKAAAAAERPSDSSGVLPVMPVAQPLQAAPLPLAQPLPQAAPLPVTEAAPVIIAEEETSTSSIHRRPYRQTPIWRQPAVLGTAGALVLFGLVAYFLSSGGKPPTTEVSTGKPPSKTNTLDTAVDRAAGESSKVKPSDSSSSPPPVPDKSSSTSPVSPTTVEPPITSKPDVVSRKPVSSPLVVVGESGSPVDVPALSLAGEPIDLLKQVDVKRDAISGNWQMEDGVLVSPKENFSKLLLPAPPSADYRIDMMVERTDGAYGIGPVLLVGGQQVTAAIDGWDGNHTGLENVDGKSCNANVTTHLGRVLNLGKPCHLVFIVHANSVQAALDGEQILNWTGDTSHLSMIREWALPDKTRLGLSVHATVCRISKLEITALAPEPTSSAPAAIAGGTVDLLKQVDVKRDAVNGDWTLVDGVLVSPDTAYARLMLPPPPGPEYQLTVVAERLKGKRGPSAAIVVDGHQTLATVDGYDGKHSGLQDLDGKDCHENESTHNGRVLTDGKPVKIIYTVRRGGVEVAVDGTKIVDWHGDAGRLSMDSRWALPDASRLGLCTYSAVCRISKIEIAPLAPERPVTTPRVAATSPDKATAGVLKIFEDEPEFVEALNADVGQAVLTQKEKYSGEASVMITGMQRFNEALPGLNVKIRHNPQGPNEYRYLRFAWKKRGGQEICLQLHHPGNWFRYRAGIGTTFGRATQISDQVPTQFVVVTRDLAADFGEFDVNGIALSAVDGDWACFDHIYLGRSLKDLDSIKVPGTKRERIFPDFASDSSSDQRSPVPDDEAIKKARQEMQKNFSSALKAAAKSPDQKRSLAQELAEKAALEDKGAPYAYVLLNQAIDLAEAAGDLDLAWKTIDQLARSFAVDGMDLRNRSLIDAGKAAKTPERVWELGDAACRLMLTALAAGDAGAVKKAGAQAQLLAKRTKDKAIQKTITGRADDAAKLAGEIEAVKQARETLKSMPLDGHANQIVGHFELCATGDWNAALPKLTRSDAPEWQKLAASEASLTGQFVDPARQLAVADAWWARAEEEPWPGRQYLHMRAAKWYANAYKSLVDVSRVRAGDRLKTLLAIDEGLPNWELFTWRGFQRDAPTGEIARVETGRGLETAVEFEGPIEVTLVLRTTGDQIRLWSHNTSGAWKFTIQPNRWHTLRYVFTPLSRAVFVDGLPVDGDAWKTARRLTSAPVYLYASDDAIVEVKKFIVKQL